MENLSLGLALAGDGVPAANEPKQDCEWLDEVSWGMEGRMMVVVGKVKGRSEHLGADSGFCNSGFDRSSSVGVLVGDTVHCTAAQRGRLGKNTRHDLRLAPGWGFPSHCEPTEMIRGEDAWLADLAPGLTVTYLVAFAALPV